MSLPMDQATVSMPRPTADSGPSPKRRKLRKGTQSCWECKRRKAKCTFSAHIPDVCDGCRRRGTDCISQESTETPPSPSSNRHLVDRLGHVETSVKRLLKAAQNDEEEGPALPLSSVRRQKVTPNRSETKQPTSGHVRKASNSNPCSMECHGSQEQISSDDSSCHQAPSITESWPDAVPDKDVPNVESYDPISRDLLAAWPTPDDMNAILRVPLESSEFIRAITGTPPKEAAQRSPPSLRNLLQLPASGAHPVLIARKMMTLALVLQTAPASSADQLDEKLSRSCEDIMSRLVKTARTLVTRDDDLISSLEGLECLMLESLYENHMGNLRRSWLITRRSVMIAQMLGLNRGVAPVSKDDNTVEPDDLWFRILSFDRYLCLMLGLPQTSTNEAFASAEILESSPANARMQRLCCVASGLLLSRNINDLYDKRLTGQIDEILQDSSTSMPAQWWVAPGLTPDVGFSIRSNDHLMQFHLLLQLHLPYLLCPNKEDAWEYHRMTAVTASREILTRFLNVHRAPRARHYCRGIDLIAFMSCTALSLSNLLCMYRRESTEDQPNYFLAHQRLSDRGLMEQVRTFAEEGARKSDDDIFKRLVTLLHHLFVFEDDVASGSRYTASFMPEMAKERDLDHQIHVSESGRTALIHLPHLPVINIERQASQETQGKELSQAFSLEFPPDSYLRPIDGTAKSSAEASQNAPLNESISMSMEGPSFAPVSTQNDLFPASEEFWVTDFWGQEGVDTRLLETL